MDGMEYQTVWILIRPDILLCFVGLNLGPNCLQRVSADDTGRQRVNPLGLTCKLRSITYKLNP